MVDRDRLLSTFLELVQIDSPSGQEQAISAHLADRLRALDMEVDVDEIGNVLGRWDAAGEYLMLSAHMDTVVPGTGITPVVRDGVICSDGTTILGGDDKSGVAVILEVLALLHEQKRRLAVEVALSVGEEIGLLGVKAMDSNWFRARNALVLDAGGALNAIVHGAPASDKLRAVIRGRAAHAGANPEDGINAILVAAQAIAAMPLGRIDSETTSNIGLIEGGRAVNVVPDLVEIRGEARSHDTNKLDAQTGVMCQSLQDAVARHEGAGLEIAVERTYHSYRLGPETPLIRRIVAALEEMGEEPPTYHLSGGGSDANVFNARGLTAVPVSTGMQSVHTMQECILLQDMVRCAELVWRVLGA